MNLTIPFLALSAVSIIFNFLDWEDTVTLIKQKGLAGEKNPIMRGLFGISKWAALAYKAVSPAIFLYAGLFFKGGDVENFLVKYSNAPGIDHWAIAWFACAAAYGVFGYIGWKNNSKELGIK